MQEPEKVYSECKTVIFYSKKEYPSKNIINL